MEESMTDIIWSTHGDAAVLIGSSPSPPLPTQREQLGTSNTPPLTPPSTVPDTQSTLPLQEEGLLDPDTPETRLNKEAYTHHFTERFGREPDGMKDKALTFAELLKLVTAMAKSSKCR